MRRLLALLVALALAWTPAEAGKLLVIQRDADATSTQNINRMKSWLSTHGVDYTWIPASRSKTLWLVAAQHFAVENMGAATQYDAVLVQGYLKNNWVTGGAFPDSIFRDTGGNSRWPAKPVIYVADWPMGGGSILGAPSAYDSLGYGGNAAQTGASNGCRLEVSLLTGRGWSTNAVTSGASLLAPSSGYTRNVLVSRFSAATAYNSLSPKSYGASGANGWYPPRRDSALAGTDSGLVVARYSLKANGDPDVTRPVITVAGTGGQFGSMVRRLEIALAMADSASGRKLLFQTRLGPIRMSVNVDGVGGTGFYDGQDPGQNGASVGLYSPNQTDSDSSASEWKAAIDTAGFYGIELTLGAQLNPDSSGNAWQVDYARDHCPTCLFYPYERAGLGDYDSGHGGAEAAGGANDATHNYDPWGAQRLRSLLPAGCTGPTACDCATSGPGGGPDTLSLYCNLLRLKNQLAARVGGGRVARVWGAPLNDWTPLYFGKSGGSIDSLVWVLNQFLGLGGMRVGIMGDINLASSSGTNAPRGWMRNVTVWPVKDPATGKPLASFVFVPSRQADNNCDLANYSGHELGYEFLVGWLSGGSWFEGFDTRPIYSSGHEFLTRLPILVFSASYMTGSGDPRYNWKPGMRWLMDYYFWIDTVNKLAGRTVLQMTSAQGVANSLIRSGLR